MQEHDSGTITAFRDGETDDGGNVVKTYSKKENKARNKMLLANLQNFSVTRVKGSYIENFKTKMAKEVREDVYFVVDHNDRGDLEGVLKKLGQKFNQDSIMFIPKGTNTGILWGTKKDKYSNKLAFPKFGTKESFPKAVWSKEAEFTTKIKNRPFSFIKEDKDMTKMFENKTAHYISLMHPDDWEKV